jgi:hypothetical protein
VQCQKKKRYGSHYWARARTEKRALSTSFGPHYELPRAWSRHQSHWYCGPPPLVYKNLSVIQWSREDVQDNCKSCRAFDHNERFGSGEENAPIYLCREQPRYWRTYSGPPKGGLK